MIFVRIDNVSNRLYAGVFKIYTKCFWFDTTAFCNNIYMISTKEFSQFSFIRYIFFVNKYCIIITYDTFTCNKQLDEIPKAFIGC